MQDTGRVLVAGGAGFIGSNLCQLLLNQGASVDAVDSLITGRIEAIQPFRKNERFRFFRMDITAPDFVNMALSTRYDEIYHLACPTGVPNISKHGEEMIRTCSIGTENILRVACAQNSKVVYASSAEVYGDPEQFPQREDYRGNVDPIGPRSAYEEGKRFGESLTRLYAEKHNVDATIVRIFNTFGIGMRTDDTRVIPSFIRCLSERRPFTVYGDGLQTRTHMYVTDLLSGLRIVCNRGKRGEAYNLGGQTPMSILALINLLRDLTTISIDIDHKPHFIQDHNGRQPLIEKVGALGWRPIVSLEEGLSKMLRDAHLPTKATRRNLAMLSRQDEQLTPLGRSIGSGA